ncbi:MAG: hypothetical protein LiPW41_523 [Parcubacteria group bacterium LiPW_41]|nr:MAG: hypothetical protein LiPW41_523 [Parcubacteria group bacterium LiPW_41]
MRFNEIPNAPKIPKTEHADVGGLEGEEKELYEKAKRIEVLTSSILEDKDKNNSGVLSRFFDRAQEIVDELKDVVSERGEVIKIASRQKALSKFCKKYDSLETKIAIFGRLGMKRENMSESEVYESLQKIYENVDSDRITDNYTVWASKIALSFASKNVEGLHWNKSADEKMSNALRWDKFLEEQQAKSLARTLDTSFDAAGYGRTNIERVKKMESVCGSDSRVLLSFLKDEEGRAREDYRMYSDEDRTYIKNALIKFIENNKTNAFVLRRIPEEILKKGELSLECKKEYLKCRKVSHEPFSTNVSRALSSVFDGMDKKDRKKALMSLVNTYGLYSNVGALAKFMMTNHLTKDEYESISQYTIKRYKVSDKEYVNNEITRGDISAGFLNSESLKFQYNGAESMKKLVSGWDYQNVILRFGDVLKYSKENNIDRDNLIKDFCEEMSSRSPMLLPLYRNQAIPPKDKRKIFDYFLDKNFQESRETVGNQNRDQEEILAMYNASKSNPDADVQYMGEKLFALYGKKEDLRHVLTEVLQGRGHCVDLGSVIEGYSHKENPQDLHNEFVEMFIRRDVLDKKYVGHFLSGLKYMPTLLESEILQLKANSPEKYNAVINGIYDRGSVDFIVSAVDAGVLTNVDDKKRQWIINEVMRGRAQRTDVHTLINSKLATPEEVMRVGLEHNPKTADMIFERYIFGRTNGDDRGAFEVLYKSFLDKKSVDFNIALIKYFPLIKEMFDGEKFIKDTEALLFEGNASASQVLRLFEITKTVRGFSFSDSFIESTISKIRESKKSEDKENFLAFYFSIDANSNSELPQNLVERCNAGVAREFFETLVRNNELDYGNAIHFINYKNLYGKEDIPADVIETLVYTGLIRDAELLDVDKYEAYYIRSIEKMKNAQPMNPLNLMSALEAYGSLKKHQLLDEKTLSTLLDSVIALNQNKAWNKLGSFSERVLRDESMSRMFENQILSRCKGDIDDKNKYQLQKMLSEKVDSKKMFGMVETYKDAQFKKIAAGSFISSFFSSEKVVKEHIGDAPPETAVKIKEIWDFIEKQKIDKSNFGLTIISLLGIREFNDTSSVNEYIASIHKALAPYKKLINSWDKEKIPHHIRATIGMEYEVTNSIEEAYKDNTGRSIEGDLSELNNFAKIGKGNDAVYEIATQVADNPYCVLAEMQLLEDTGFLDFNFKKEGYKNGARGMHVTIGGNVGLRGTSNTHFLHNALIASNWGGLNAGKNISGVARGRAYPIRERTHTSTPAVEMRSLSIDKKEPLERSLVTAHLGAIAIQALEKYTTLNSELVAKEADTFPKTKEEFASYLKDKSLVKQEIPDEKTLSAIFAWCRMIVDIYKSVDSHNENFLEQETMGYLDEKEKWVDAQDFGGKENKTRFEGVAKSSGQSLEEYIEKTTKIPTNSLFKEADASFINSCTSIANLFIKPSTEMKGDKANAAAVLSVTKIGDRIEDDSFQNAEEFSFENKGARRRGYYSFQGGSKDMVIHAIQRSLLSFREEMEDSFALS